MTLMAYLCGADASAGEPAGGAAYEILIFMVRNAAANQRGRGVADRCADYCVVSRAWLRRASLCAAALGVGHHVAPETKPSESDSDAATRRRFLRDACRLGAHRVTGRAAGCVWLRRACVTAPRRWRRGPKHRADG